MRGGPGFAATYFVLCVMVAATSASPSEPAFRSFDPTPISVIAWTFSAGGHVASSAGPPSGATLGQGGPIGSGTGGGYFSFAGFWGLISGSSVSGFGDLPVLQDGLWQNRPNPFNPSTSIHYAVAREGVVAIRIYNVRGEKLRTLFDGMIPAGLHRITWDGRDDAGAVAPSGVYFVTLEIGNRNLTRKMVLLR